MIGLQSSLARLSISGYMDRNLRHKIGSLTAMYNPDAVRLNYETKYESNDSINSTILSNDYATTKPGTLSFELIFDARMPGKKKKKKKKAIDKQLARLRHLCYDVNASRGEPHFLKIKWGKLQWANKGYFAGRMVSLTYNYTLFDRDATPLRATATLVVVADPSIALQASQKSLKSPPIRVLKVLPGGGGLPLIAAAASAALAGGTDYLSLAWSNNLDNLGDIVPGGILQAPSLEGG
jgi:hypothetical protein